MHCIYRLSLSFIININFTIISANFQTSSSSIQLFKNYHSNKNSKNYSCQDCSCRASALHPLHVAAARTFADNDYTSITNSQLKGEVSPNNNVDWVSRKQFTNPTVKVWADLDNPLKRSDYAKLCMSPSLDGTLPEYVISQEDNSPLTLYM